MWQNFHLVGTFEKYCLTGGTDAFNFCLASCSKMLETEIFMKIHTEIKETMS
jgi:hypothetical protein